MSITISTQQHDILIIKSCQVIDFIHTIQNIKNAFEDCLVNYIINIIDKDSFQKVLSEFLDLMMTKYRKSANIKSIELFLLDNLDLDLLLIDLCEDIEKANPNYFIPECYDCGSDSNLLAYPINTKLEHKYFICTNCWDKLMKYDISEYQSSRECNVIDVSDWPSTNEILVDTQFDKNIIDNMHKYIDNVRNNLYMDLVIEIDNKAVTGNHNYEDEVDWENLFNTDEMKG